MKTIIGNLLDVQAGTILHQVNCRGVVGGLAAALYSRWPAAFEPYFVACKKDGHFALGGFVLGEAKPGLLIGHVFGQMNPGATTDMDAVNRGLFGGSKANCLQPVHAPYRMGCGIGGGKWADYKEQMEEFFPDFIMVRRPDDR